LGLEKADVGVTSSSSIESTPTYLVEVHIYGLLLELLEVLYPYRHRLGFYPSLRGAIDGAFPRPQSADSKKRVEFRPPAQGARQG